MRWFVVFLLIANIGLFFWVQQDALDALKGTDIPPPDIGRLRLLNESEDSVAANDDAVELTDTTPPAIDAPPPSSAANSDQDPAIPPIEAESVTREVERAVEPLVPVETVDARDGVSPEPATPPAQEPGPETEPTADSEIATVVAPAVPTVPPIEEMSAAAPLPLCARVGPFVPADADALLSKLPAHITLVSDTSEETAVVNGYYVLVPPMPNRAAGLAKLKELGAAGFGDTWLFRRGEFRNAISMGLFRRAASAQRHAEKVTQKGFEVEIREKTSRGERRWLMLKEIDGGDLRGALPLPKGVELTQQACPG